MRLNKLISCSINCNMKSPVSVNIRQFSWWCAKIPQIMLFMKDIAGMCDYSFMPHSLADEKQLQSKDNSEFKYLPIHIMLFILGEFDANTLFLMHLTQETAVML